MSTSTPEQRSLEFWRRTPVALFPTMMGLLGLGLAWRSAAVLAPFAISTWIGDSILLIACVLELFVVSCYLSKVSYRFGVITEDMASVPGRAGVSAITISLFLFAAALIPYSPTIAKVTLVAALLLHVFTTVLAVVIMFRTSGGLVVSPAWHLSFVGIIVACLVAVPLGFVGLAKVIFFTAFSFALLIYGISLFQLSKTDMPAPMRPMLFVHLAPVSLFATVTASLGYSSLALVFTAIAVGVFAVLVSATRYITAAGFSPLWGAFTFPIAAVSVALLTLSTQVSTLAWFALVPLAVVSIMTPVIVIRVLLMWSTGVLATKTGAATA